MNNINFDEIRQKCDIVKVVSSYIPLSRKGRNLVAVCPFHDDTNPSMSVSSEKQIYKCFACGAAGNVFTFVQNFEKIPFLQAVEKAASICDVPVPTLGKNLFETPISDEDKRLYNLLNEAKQFYSYNLLTEEGRKANEYLEKRNLTKDIIEKFGIGYALEDGNKIVRYLQAKGYSIDEMIECGLVTRTNNGIIDMLKGRVIFPIQDHQNKTVGFSGRIMEKSSSESKYVNTIETKFFKKSSILYNYYNAAQSIRKEQKVYVLEGFMDVIALYRGGIESAVATMGVALTPEHATSLKKLGAEILLVFDSDQAGQRATFKTIELFDRFRIRYKVVKPFDKYKDADEIVNNLKSEGLKAALNRLYTPLEYQINYLANFYNLANHEDKKKFIVETTTLVSKLDDLLDLNYYSDLIAKLAQTDVRIIKEYIRPVSKPEPRRVQTFVKPKFTSRKEQSQLLFVKLMLTSPLAIIEYQKRGVILFDSIADQLAAYILDYYKKNINLPKEADLYSYIEDKNLVNQLSNIALIDNQGLSSEEIIKIAKDEYQNFVQENKLNEIKSKTNDPLEQAKLLKEYYDSIKNKQ